MNKTPEQVADDLNAIYEEAFAGKRRGRYKISRSKLRRLSGRKRLESSIVSKIAEVAYEEHALVVVELGDDFAVIRESVMQTYRPVPKSILSEFGEEKREADEIDEDAENL